MTSGKSEVAAFIGLGGNLGDPAATMAEALQQLESSERTRVEAVSSLYRTPPWGKTDQPDFLNAVAKVETTHSPQGLLEICLHIERNLKRVRAERWGPRSIDMDVLWYDGERIELPGLTIPHPRMLDRAFVLVPLAEIAPALDLSGISARERASSMEQAGIKVAATGDWWRLQED